MTLTQQKTQALNPGSLKKLNASEGVLMVPSLAQGDIFPQVSEDLNPLVTIRLGKVTSTNGSVQKKFDLKEGKAVKDPKHFQGVSDGFFEDLEVQGLEGLAELLDNTPPNVAYTLGVCDLDGRQNLTTDKELANKLDAIARTKDCIDWPEGPKLLMLDVDPEPGKDPLTASELWDLMTEVIPDLKDVGHLVTESTSSQIFNKETGECLKGSGRFHLFLVVTGDVEKIRETLKTLFWAKGLGFFKLGKPNQNTKVPSILERFPTDMAVISPERLVYEAGALLGEGLEQRRHPAQVSPGGILNLDLIVASPEQTELAKVNRDKARKAKVEERFELTVTTVQEETGLPKAKAKKEAKTRIDMNDAGKLHQDHPIHLMDGTTVLAGDLTKEHDQMTCKDPQEPDYHGGAQKGKIYWNKGDVQIYSQAHGGKNYTVTDRKLGKWMEKAKAKAAKGAEQLGQPESAWRTPIVENYTTGFMVAGGRGRDAELVFRPRLGCDLTIERIIQSKDGGQMSLNVKWLAGDTLKTQVSQINIGDTYAIRDFAKALSTGLGVQISCTLQLDELQALLQHRKSEYYFSGGQTYKLADRVGQQEDGLWIFKNIQFMADGTPTTEEQTLVMFNSALINLENIPSPVIAPQNPEALRNLAQAIQKFYSPEALPYVWLTIGFTVMGLHRKNVMGVVGELASLAIYGQVGGGKSIAQKAAASLYGLHDWKFSEVSVSQFGELAKSLGSLPIQWDDPIRQGRYAVSDEEKVNSALWKLFTGLGRAVRGNSQAPNTVVSVSSNRTLGAGNTAILSRLISFYFPLHPLNRSSGAALHAAMGEASGGLSQLLGIPYDVQAISAQNDQLLALLSEANARNSNSLATLSYFTQAFCDLAGVEFEALTFVKTNICPQTNDQGAGKSDLTDFLEKLVTLKTEGLVGDWNLNEHVTDRQGKRFLAIHMDSVWEQVEDRFSPNYGKSLIAQLAEDAGGKRNVPKYFVDTKAHALEYQRLLNHWAMVTGKSRESGDGAVTVSDRPTEPKRDRPAKALLIPRDVAESAGFYPRRGGEDPDTLE
jgi:hypothetical protein